MILFINACARKESRTKRLADALLNTLGAYEEIDLYKSSLKPVDAETLEKRTALIEKGDFDAPMFDMARRFARADKIVVAAPYWDMSFPSILKVFIENIYIVGLVSRYDENGMPVGMCRADTLYYVTTAGGKYIPTFSFDYMTDMVKKCFGIKETKLVMAEMLDIVGCDAEEILARAVTEISGEKPQNA